MAKRTQFEITMNMIDTEQSNVTYYYLNQDEHPELYIYLNGNYTFDKNKQWLYFNFPPVGSLFNCEEDMKYNYSRAIDIYVYNADGTPLVDDWFTIDVSDDWEYFESDVDVLYAVQTNFLYYDHSTWYMTASSSVVNALTYDDSNIILWLKINNVWVVALLIYEKVNGSWKVGSLGLKMNDKWIT